MGQIARQVSFFIPSPNSFTLAIVYCGCMVVNKHKFFFILLLLGFKLPAIAQQCQASFQYKIDSFGYVQFQADSVGASLQHVWRLNDTATIHHTAGFTYRFGLPGNNLVKHILIDSQQQCTDTIVQAVNVPVDCRAKMTLSDEGNSKLFYDGNVQYFGGWPYQYHWDFGDGQTASLRTDTHQYSVHGTYPVKLIVTSNGGSCKDSIKRVINIKETCTGSIGFKAINNSNTARVWNATTNGHFTQEWSVPGSPSFSTDSTTLASFDSAGTYPLQMVQYTADSSCMDTTFASIRVTGKCKARFEAKPSIDDDQAWEFTEASQLFSSNQHVSHNYWLISKQHRLEGIMQFSRYIAGSKPFNVEYGIETNTGCQDTISATVVSPSQAKPCRAQFNFSQKDESSRTVLFQDLSIAGSWESTWYFGDGQTADNKQLQHTYGQDDTFMVTLFIQDSVFGCQDSITRQVPVFQRNCAAAFSYQLLPKQLAIKAWSSSTDTLVKSSWQIAGKTRKTGDTVRFNLNDTGEFSIWQKIEIGSCTDSSRETFSLLPLPCRAAFSVAAFEDLSVNIQNLSTGFKLQYNWFIDDEQTSSDQNPSPTFRFEQYGQYSLRLEIEDSLGHCHDQTEKIIMLKNPDLECTAAFGFEVDPLNPLSVSFNSLSDRSLTHSWHFGVDGATASNKQTTYSYAEAGDYTVSLVVTDTLTGCQDSTSLPIALKNCNALFTFGIDTLNTTTVYVFDQSVGKELEYQWSFGDGTVSTRPYPTHAYNAFGNYRLCLKVKSAQNQCEDQFCQSFTLNADGQFSFKKEGFNLVILPGDTFPSTSSQPITEQDAINVYPNPFTENVVLQSTDASPITQCQIVHASGKRVWTSQQTILQQPMRLDASSWPPGMYLLQFTTAKGHFTKMLIKQP